MRTLFSHMSVQSIGAGILAAIVGYTSSIAVVIHGMQAVGASQAEISSGLTILCLAMGFCGVALSLFTRQPVSVVWTTPGMVLLSSQIAPQGGYPAAVGAFIITGILIAITGFWATLGNLVMRIPRSVTSGMLAGILFKLCLAPITALGSVPEFAVPVILTWLLVGRFARLWAAPAAFCVALSAIIFSGQTTLSGSLMPELHFVSPVFSWAAMVSIALPLFIVTMASQNIPGLAVLTNIGYRPKARPLFLTTGLTSSLSALFGGIPINLAAITAVLCAGPDAHPAMERRYVAAVTAGLVYAAMATLSSIAAQALNTSLPILVEAAAGLALIGAFGSSMLGAVQDEEGRLPALATFLVTASGFTLYGIGAAFWGLTAGLAVHFLYAFPIRRGATNAAKTAK